VNGHPLTVFQIPSSRQIGTDTAQSSGLRVFSDTVYSRSPRNPALQQLQKSVQSASMTPQRPIWNYFATVAVRDFWENGCNPVGCALRFSCCLQQFCMFSCEKNSTAHLLLYPVPIFCSLGRGPYSLVIAMLHASIRCKREERTTCPGGT